MSRKEIYDLPDQALLTDREVADLIGVRWQTLARWRSNGSVPLPFRKFGNHVRYLKKDVLEFQADRGFTRPRGTRHGK